MRPQLAAGRTAAFTLIELLVVIVVLGILMAVAVPTFLRQQSKAQDSRTQQYLTTAFKAIRSGIPDTNNQYPSSTSLVSWVQQSEPELSVQRAGCYTGTATAPTDAVLVDPSSSGNALLLCARSASGNVWELSATATSAPTLINGTLVPLTFSGNEITDATRAPDVQGDGLSNDSSTGIWEATTNFELNGGLESNASFWSGWAHLGFSPAPVVSRDTSIAKFGSASLKVVTQGANVSEGAISSTAANSVSPATVYTVSAWVYCATTQQFQFGIDWKDSSGTFISGSNTTSTVAGGTWTRLKVTATSPANTNFLTVTVYASNGAPTPTTFWVDGVQAEQKSLATPYVETSGATASRSASRVQAPASLLSSSQGWFAVRLRMGFPSTSTNAIFSANGENFRLAQWQDSGATRLLLVLNGSNQLLMQRQIAGVGNSATSTAISFARGDTVTVVGSWDANDVYVSVNGTPFTSATNSSIPTLVATKFDIGSDNGINGWLDGDLLWFATGTGTLTDADAATINSFGNTDPTRANFPASARTTMTWDGTSTTGSLK